MLDLDSMQWSLAFNCLPAACATQFYGLNFVVNSMLSVQAFATPGPAPVNMLIMGYGGLELGQAEL